ncbi:fimbrial protein [Escherichia coli]|nr:fimbrial protein [Escherichia coli]
MDFRIAMDKKLLALLILASLSPAEAALTKIPAGFEVIAQGQQEYIEVYFSGKNLGKYYAMVNLDTVTFLDPTSLYNKLELDVDDQKIAHIVKEKLSQPLARHGELACGYVRTDSGCGFLNTDTLEIIYNDEESSATLFINPQWNSAFDAKSLYLNPDKNTVNAFIHQQDINVLAQDDYQSLSIQGNGALGITENSYIGAHWNFNGYDADDVSDSNADVSDLYYRYDFLRRYYVQAGRMDNRTLFNAQGGNFTFNFLPLGAIDGMRIGSTLSYLNQAQSQQGTPVMVLLSRNSRVDAYRNEQLLGSFYLNSGSQFIDTSSFPPGSYSVALKVYENNQLTRTELVPFTKTGGLTDGNAQWFLQAGKTTSQASDDESSAYQLGVRLPLHPQYELYAGLANADNVSAFELGNDWTANLGGAGNLAISASVFRNDDGGKGDMQQANWSNSGWPTLGFYRTNSDGDACATDSRESYNALSCYESISATVSQNFVGWNMMLGYSRTQNNTDDSLRWDKQQSFENNYLRQTTAQSISETVQLSASRAFVMRDWILSTSVGVFHRNDNGGDNDDNGLYLSFSLSDTPTMDSNNNSHSTNVSTDYRYSDQDGDQTSWQLSHTFYNDSFSHKELGVTVGGLNTDTINSAVNGRWDGQYGNVYATVSDSYDRKNHDHLSAFTGTYSSTLAVSRYGVNLGASGTDDLLGAVLVDVKGFSEQDEESQDLQLEARVAGSRTLQLGQSDSVLFPYPGFQSGFVEVNDSSQGNQQGTTNIINGAGNRELMLLPGKLRYREVSASFNYNYIGRLLLPASVEKFPLVGLNSAMLLVAEDGGFTLEINGSEKELYLLSGQQFLKCPLSVVKKRASIRYSGDVTCSVVTYSQLPESIQVQAQLKQPKLRGNVQTAPNVTSEITYDLANGRADYYFWNEEPPPEVSYSTTFSFFQCSYPDSQQTCTSAGNTSVVQIYLTEKRSGMRWPVKLKGYMTVQVWEDGPCKGWYDKKRLDDGTGYQCKDTINNVGYLAKTKVLTLYIEQEEMKKLPIGGLWEGKVKLHFSYPATDYQADIKLNVLDPNHIDVFFPEFAHATPRVQLDLHPTGSVNGSNYAQDLTMLDMCLYDGFNGNAISYEIMLKDEGRPAAGRRDGDFSIYRQGGTTTDEGERIDYRVKMYNPETGGQIDVRNNENMVWNSINLKRVRPVVLPGIRYAVMCVPTPLTLAVEKFSVMDKQAGYYMGKLSVIFTPSLPTIN